MSVDYTIAAIPTDYRGRRYRSRLEARWAAFFDVLGWRHEYEPFDLGAWSPDFLLTEWQFLVEVKPLEDFDEATWNKAIGACHARDLLRGDNAPIMGLFLTRLAPAKERFRDTVHVGWFGMSNNDFRPEPAYLVWKPCFDNPAFTAEIACLDRRGWFTASGDAAPWAGPGSRYNNPVGYEKHTMRLWAQATNAVQYRPDPQS